MTCGTEGCFKHSSCGGVGCGEREFLGSKAGMVNVEDTRCDKNDCPRRVTRHVERLSKDTFCRQHGTQRTYASDVAECSRYDHASDGGWAKHGFGSVAGGRENGCSHSGTTCCGGISGISARSNRTGYAEGRLSSKKYSVAQDCWPERPTWCPEKRRQALS